MRRALAVSVACLTLGLAAPAFADDDPVATAKALDKAHKPAEAADAWEKAYAATNTPKHLYLAGRDRQKSGALARAANDYQRYLAAAPATQRKERAAAQRALNALQPKLGRFAVRASGSDKMSVDGEVVDPKLAENWYVTAGPHTVEATFGKATAKEQGTAVVGEQVAVVLAAPPESEEPPAAAAVAAAAADPPAGNDTADEAQKPAKASEPFSLPPLAVYVAGGVTVVLGAATIISAIDTQSAKSTFEKSKTQANLDAGKSKQTRTNVLLAATGVAAVATVGMFFFVDWKKAGIKLGLGPGSGFVAGTF